MLIVLLVCVDALYQCQQFFNHAQMLPELNQYYAENKVSQLGT